MRIPKTADAAVKELTSLGALLSARQWDRAALVYALVGPEMGKGRPPKPDEESLKTETFPYSTVSLAKVKLIGLSSSNSVALYRDAWQDAIDRGEAKPVALGGSYKTPKIDWPPTRTGTDGFNSQDGAAKTIKKIVEKHGPAVIAEAVKDPVVADAVAADPDAGAAVRQAEMRTPEHKATQQGIRRAVKGHEARMDGPKYLRANISTAGAMMELLGWLETIHEEYTFDEEGAGVARLIAQAVRRELAMLEAWAGGDLAPLEEADFDREMQALMGEQS